MKLANLSYRFAVEPLQKKRQGVRVGVGGGRKKEET